MAPTCVLFWSAVNEGCNALIVGVFRREIVVLGVPAPEVVKARDGVSRVISDFCSVVVESWSIIVWIIPMSYSSSSRQ